MNKGKISKSDNEDGVIDLASVMVGVIVIGLIGGIIAATLFTIIPWAQDNAAKAQLDSIATAQSAYAGFNVDIQGLSIAATMPTVVTGDNYGTLAQLKTKQLFNIELKEGSQTVSADGNICTAADQVAGTYSAAVKSASGTVFIASSENPRPIKAPPNSETCIGKVNDQGQLEPPIPVVVDTRAKMVTTWDTSLPGCSTIILPIEGATGIGVDWGDGTKDNSITSNNPTHTYSTGGQKTVTSYGQFYHWGTASANTNPCLLNVTLWEETGTKSLWYGFAGATNLTAISNIPSGIENLANTFSGATKFNQNINNWDVSNVTDMQGIFSDTTNFNQPLNNWNTSNVNNLRNAFGGAIAFNQNINNWDVSSVTDMGGVFFNTAAYNQPLFNWNMSAVETTRAMFSGAKAFNSSINGWDVSNVTDMSIMFSYTPVFNQPINYWSTDSLTNMSGMFQGTGAFNQTLDSFKTGKVTDMSALFQEAQKFNFTIYSWDTSKVTNMSNMFYQAKAFNKNINNWNVSSVTDMSGMFYANAIFNQPLNSWNVSNVTSMNSMFRDNTAFNQTLVNWNVSNVTDMSAMFNGATVFNQPLNWNVSKVIGMWGMFQNASTFNQNISTWNVANVTDWQFFSSTAPLTLANTPAKFR